MLSAHQHLVRLILGARLVSNNGPAKRLSSSSKQLKSFHAPVRPSVRGLNATPNPVPSPSLSVPKTSTSKASLQTFLRSKKTSHQVFLPNARQPSTQSIRRPSIQKQPHSQSVKWLPQPRLFHAQTSPRRSPPILLYPGPRASNFKREEVSMPKPQHTLALKAQYPQQCSHT
jgi:hypothetical protein